MHPFWNVERKKLSKKYGRLIRSSESSLNAMMWEHREAVEKFLLHQSGLPDETMELPNADGGGSIRVEGDGDTIMVTATTGS
jgi:hypothetical protein